MIKDIESKNGKETEVVFITCDCGGEILRVEKWDDSWGLFTIQMYRTSAFGFWGRVKMAWKYFRYGELYGNDMTVGKDDLKGLIEFLGSTKELLEEEGK